VIFDLGGRKKGQLTPNIDAHGAIAIDGNQGVVDSVPISLCAGTPPAVRDDSTRVGCGPLSDFRGLRHQNKRNNPVVFAVLHNYET
jgi:hypothetical protein